MRICLGLENITKASIQVRAQNTRILLNCETDHGAGSHSLPSSCGLFFRPCGAGNFLGIWAIAQHYVMIDTREDCPWQEHSRLVRCRRQNIWIPLRNNYFSRSPAHREQGPKKNMHSLCYSLCSYGVFDFCNCPVRLWYTWEVSDVCTETR